MSYYWNNSFLNNDGWNLWQCETSYGTEVVFSPEQGIYYKIVFLDARKTRKYSWLLWVRRLSDDRDIPVRLHEEDPQTAKRLFAV